MRQTDMDYSDSGRKILILCNSPYQLFVAAWLKTSLFANDLVDVVISDHMNNGRAIADNTRRSNVFHNVFFLNEHAVKPSRFDNHISRFFCPAHLLSKYIKLHEKYDYICVSNLHVFDQLLFRAISNGLFSKIYNRKVKIFLFEDGISSYAKSLEKKYLKCSQKEIWNSFLCKPGELLRKIFYYPVEIYGNLAGVFVFNKERMLWHPDAPVYEIPRIDRQNDDFKKSVNTMFDYSSSTDLYDRKVIFFEEAFFTDGFQVNDVEILDQIAQAVGKDNIMVKIHPRNPVNRFAQKGYKTNKDTHIPWELIVLNQDMGKKIFLTFSSAAVLNPARLFDVKTKTYCLYHFFNEIPLTLAGDNWEATRSFYSSFYPAIEIVDADIRELQNALKKACAEK